MPRLASCQAKRSTQGLVFIQLTVSRMNWLTCAWLYLAGCSFAWAAVCGAYSVTQTGLLWASHRAYTSRMNLAASAPLYQCKVMKSTLGWPCMKTGNQSPLTGLPAMAGAPTRRALPCT